MLKLLFIGRAEIPAIHLLRSIQVSLAATLLDFSLLALLVENLRMHYLAAASVSFAAGSTLSYYLSVNWVFATRSISRRHLEYLIFVGIGGAGLLLNAAIMFILVEKAQQHYLIAKAISGAMVFLINFIARRSILFSKGPESAGQNATDQEEQVMPICSPLFDED